jgi:hypothetical protein
MNSIDLQEPPSRVREVNVSYPPVSPIPAPPLTKQRSLTPKSHRLRTVLIAALILVLAALWLADMMWPRLQRKEGNLSLAKTPNQDLPLSYDGGLASLPPIDKNLADRIRRTMVFVTRQVNPDTGMGYSFTGDRRLRYWGLVYDNSMRAMAHLQTGRVDLAEREINFLLRRPGIKQTGRILLHGVQIPSDGWLVNIVDASDGRYAGRGVEHMIHAGPNIYAGIASLHIYRATGKSIYLQFSRECWDRVADLQNRNRSSPNYGGIRMGPLPPEGEQSSQHLGFNKNNPCYYNFYNGEHAADFLAFSHLLARLDPSRAERYLDAAKLIEKWDHRIYDRSRHLFYIGTTEVAYREEATGEMVAPGVIRIIPLDTNALKISAYGVDGLETFEKNAAEKIRFAIDHHFRVQVPVKTQNGIKVMASGYDFIDDKNRKKLLLYIEGGPQNDQKIVKGVGRGPLLTDEWSNWVALADLRLSEDFEAKGDSKRAAYYRAKYYDNAVVEASKTGIDMGKEGIAYPYAHPLPYALNKPVGFGWNTHHEPYAMISGVARVLGFLRFDPFAVDGGPSAVHITVPTTSLAVKVRKIPSGVLYTEAELYIRKAWDCFNLAKQHNNEEGNWRAAINIINSMLSDHPDWAEAGVRQGRKAAISDDPFPLRSTEDILETEAFPVYRKYWALYHIGTAFYIRALAYGHLAALYRDKAEKSNAQAAAAANAAALVEHYLCAQTLDPGGWFWQPALVVRDELILLGVPARLLPPSVDENERLAYARQNLTKASANKSIR